MCVRYVEAAVIHDPIGRDVVIKTLTPLPLCSLLLAPPSTGKCTVAEFLVKRANIHAVDCRMFPQSYWTDEKGRRSDSGGLRLVEPELTMSMVRELIEWTRVAPSSPRGRVAIVRLNHVRQDGTEWRASARCMTAMLKLIEEPPAGVRFVLLASGGVLPTIASRCVSVRSGLLSLDEVAEILYRVSDLDRTEARSAAALGGGRVGPSLSARAEAVGAREAVLGFLGSLMAADMDAVSGRARGWSDVQTKMLIRALHERVSERYSVFSFEELSSINLSIAMKLLSLLSRFNGSRPKVLLGAVAAAVVKG